MLRAFTAASASCVLAIGLANALVDPYGYLGTPGVARWTREKPKAFEHDRFFKAGLVRRVRADCLLAGSSRVGEGIPPQHTALAACGNVLDVSLAGPNVVEMTAIVRAAQSRSKVSTVLLSLDFFAFNALRIPTRGGDHVFAGGAAAGVRSALSILASSETLADSWSTVVGQHQRSFYQPDGSVDQQYLAATEIARPTRATFLRGARGYILHHLPAPHHRFELVTSNADPMFSLRDFLVEQQRAGTRVIAFFSPAHAWQWELIDALGLWSQWEAWKRAVVVANETAAALTARPAFALWDFAGYVGPALEEVPQDDNSMRRLSGYWDASHFKRLVGAQILQRALGDSQADGDFGEILSSSTVEDALRRNRLARDLWRSRHADDVRAIREVVACFAPTQVLKRLEVQRGDQRACTALATLTR